MTLKTELPEESVKLEADAERVGQILDNLLRNALNFTERVSITVTVRQAETHAIVTIRDTGAGVDPSHIASIFDAVQLADDRTRGDGLGLGLSLVKSLVELHRGSVAFGSEGLGLGSEVSFTLPLVPRVTAARRAGC